MLLLNSIRARAQDDDYLGYRRGVYREDGNRIHVDTQTVGWELGLGKLGLDTGDKLHFSVTGEFVDDAISGASPNGALPSSQWNYENYQDFLNVATTQYNASVVQYNSFVNSKFNEALTNPGFQVGSFQNDYVDLLVNYGTSLFPTYADYTNYVASDALRQITNFAGSTILAATPATGAAANYANFVNSINRSGKVPLSTLEDHRRSYSIGVPVTYGNQTLTPEYSNSREHDYHSRGFSLNYSILLNKKNTTISAGWSHDIDRVYDSGLESYENGRVWQGKVSDDFIVGLNQLIDSKSYFTVDFTYAQEYGYLNDPYRVVSYLNWTGAQYDGHETSTDPTSPGDVVPEERPRRRTKEIYYMDYTRFFDRAHGSVDAGYRFFHDSYGVFAHTAELTWHQKLGKALTFSPGLRYYYQTAATFYTTAITDYSTPPKYYSADYRLSEMNTWSVSGAFNLRVAKHFSLDASYMRYVMQGLDGVTSQTAYPTANVYSFGGRIIF